MANRRIRHDWQQTAELIATTINMHRDPSKRPIRGCDVIDLDGKAEQPDQKDQLRQLLKETL